MATCWPTAPATSVPATSPASPWPAGPCAPPPTATPSGTASSGRYSNSRLVWFQIWNSSRVGTISLRACLHLRQSLGSNRYAAWSGFGDGAGWKLGQRYFYLPGRSYRVISWMRFKMGIITIWETFACRGIMCADTGWIGTKCAWSFG